MRSDASMRTARHVARQAATASARPGVWHGRRGGSHSLWTESARSVQAPLFPSQLHCCGRIVDDQMDARRVSAICRLWLNHYWRRTLTFQLVGQTLYPLPHSCLCITADTPNARQSVRRWGADCLRVRGAYHALRLYSTCVWFPASVREELDGEAGCSGAIGGAHHMISKRELP